MAFAGFADAGVDVAVIETGLGGRLDSTNVVRPVVAGVTSIGIDHVEYLGDTPGGDRRREGRHLQARRSRGRSVSATRPLPRLLDRARRARGRPSRSASVVARRSHHATSRSATTGPASTLDGGRRARPRCTRRWLARTRPRTPRSRCSCCAWRRRQFDGPRWRHVGDALPSVRLPGRFHRHGQFIFDVAHNPDGAAVLAATLGAVQRCPPGGRAAHGAGGQGLARTSCPRWRRRPTSSCSPMRPRRPRAGRGRAADAGAFARGQGWATVVEDDFDGALHLAPRAWQDRARDRILSHGRRRDGSLAGRSAGTVAFDDVSGSAPRFSRFLSCRPRRTQSPVRRMARRGDAGSGSWSTTGLRSSRWSSTPARAATRSSGSSTTSPTRAAARSRSRPEMTPTFARMVAGTRQRAAEARAVVLDSPAVPLRAAAEGPPARALSAQRRHRRRDATSPADAELLAVAIEIMRGCGLTADDRGGACLGSPAADGVLRGVACLTRACRPPSPRSTRSSASPATSWSSAWGRRGCRLPPPPAILDIGGAFRPRRR